VNNTVFYDISIGIIANIIYAILYFGIKIFYKNDIQFNTKIIYIQVFSALIAIGSIGAFSFVFYQQINAAIITSMTFAVIIFVLFVHTSYLMNVRNRLIGFTNFDPNYKVEKNRAIWALVKKSICYLGVSSHTFFPLFKSWIQSLPNNMEMDLKFLVINPDNLDLLRELILFRHDGNIEQDDVNKKLNEDQERIRHHIKCLKNLTIGKKLITIEVRVYDMFVPWWMYIVDEKKVYLGLLPKGKDGMDAPLLNFQINPAQATIASSYMHFWDQLWKLSKNA